MENQLKSSLTRALLCVAALGMLVACGALSPAQDGGVSYAPDGSVNRTFAFSLARVKTASLGAFGRMGIRHVGTQTTGSGEILKGRIRDRDIDLVLEPLGPAATRIRVRVRAGRLDQDRATAAEVIVQTERLLGDG